MINESMKLTLLTAILALRAFSQELRPVPLVPPGTGSVLSIEQIQADNEHLKAKLTQALQELEIWQNPAVMQVRLAVALTGQKVEEVKKKKK